MNGRKADGGVRKDLVVIGAGPAGLAAAIEAKRSGIDDILVLERDRFPGGILNQCIHDGFGLIRFGESLTGPEYARRFITKAEREGIDIETGAAVSAMSGARELSVMSAGGLRSYRAGAVVIATGCRERTRGAVGIPGNRPAGIFTAGTVQSLVNLQNIMVGRKIVILGSGDIGLIMARRLTLEGAEVLAVIEQLPQPSGLRRNVLQCLVDFDIPLLLSHTVTRITGNGRVTGVTVSRLKRDGTPIRGSARRIPCDTLVLSVGLIPDNDVFIDAGVLLDETTGGALVDENLMTSVQGVFACGNAHRVHDLVDNVSTEGERAGRAAADFLLKKSGFPLEASLEERGHG